MRSRGVLAGVVLGCALMSGGWLLTRGLNSSSRSRVNGPKLFSEVLSHVARSYVDSLSDSLLYVDAVNGLINDLHDPHSSYLSAQTLARFNERTSGRYAGVGTQIDVRDGWITVVAPLPGGPAGEAGVQTGDRIVEINGTLMRGTTVDEARTALRGEPGSTVRLTIERPGAPAHIKLALTRREIEVRSVQHPMMIGDGIGYVALTIFSERSVTELRVAIDSLIGVGMSSLILDLRGDPGGILDQGVGVADLFLNEGASIVSLKGRTQAMGREYFDQVPQAWPALIVTVLVDGASASASEIVAGALQDHDRALVVGRTSYGKGSAQNLFPVKNGGAVKLTTALWFTPSGRSINVKRSDDGAAPDSSTAARPRYKTDAGRAVLGGGGITPDVILPIPAVVPTDSALAAALGKKIPQFNDALTDYALSLKASRAVTSPGFTVTAPMRAELLRRMAARGISLDTSIYAAGSAAIDRRLGVEIARYVFGEGAGFKRQLGYDVAVDSTLRLIRGAGAQQTLFDRVASRKK